MEAVPPPVSSSSVPKESRKRILVDVDGDVDATQEPRQCVRPCQGDAQHPILLDTSEHSVCRDTASVCRKSTRENDICVSLWCDGGARGNPGIAGAGVAIDMIGGDGEGQMSRITAATPSTPMFQCWFHCGDDQTNNVAEWTAVTLALTLANLVIGASHVTVFADSLLVVNQLNGDWKVKDESRCDPVRSTWCNRRV